MQLAEAATFDRKSGEPRDLRFRGPFLETRNTMHKSIVILPAPLPMTWGRVRACSPKISVFL